MPRAVILTALPVEYLAVRVHLSDLQEEMHPQGTIYEQGTFAANEQTWEVGIAEVGAGNAGAAVEAERAIAHFKPDILFFVGIAGGIKDVAIGDVAVATDVYGYEAGKVGGGQQFFVRPKAGKSAYAIVQRARSEARKGEWVQRLPNPSSPQPRVFVAPIVTGEKVVISRASDLFQFLRTSYNDAIAVEMEGFGFLSAAFAYPNIQSIVIRGISDLIEGKSAVDPEEGTEEERQARASQNASAFAFELLAKLQIQLFQQSASSNPSTESQMVQSDSAREGQPPSSSPASQGIGKKPSSKLGGVSNKIFEDKLINFLTTIHPLGRRENRDILLNRLPKSLVLVISRYDATLSDIDNIVRSAEGWGWINEKGKFALEILVENALRFVEGTHQAEELGSLKQEFLSRNSPNKFTVSPSVSMKPSSTPFLRKRKDVTKVISETEPDNTYEIVNTTPENLELSDLFTRARLFRISPKTTEQVKNALNSFPPVVEREKELAREMSQYSNEANEKPQKLDWPEKQEILSKNTKVPRQYIGYFFTGKPIARSNFINLCNSLRLLWQSIVDVDFLRVLVEVVPQERARQFPKIEDQCGTLQMLDINYPIDLDSLYVDVNIVGNPFSQQWREISEMPQIYNFNTAEIDYFALSKIQQFQRSGLKVAERFSKLMVLGKPGSGKSTFLQYLAILCNRNQIETDRVPIFIQLRSFVRHAHQEGHFDLLRYIYNASSNLNKDSLEKLLQYGRVFILLDGLDEMPENDCNITAQQIINIREKYFDNKFAITCRVAAREDRFSGFTYVEIADFNQKQIEEYSKKWFSLILDSDCDSEEKANFFIKELKKPKNWQIRELVVTPILLNLACYVFSETGKFPSSRLTLYEEGLEILLRKWDQFKRINRDESYRDLSLLHKKQMLSKVAIDTFENNQYFFAEDDVQFLIAEYLDKLESSKSKNLEDLLPTSAAVLKSIEIQHGLLVERARKIYSFSHLTLQEYLSARFFLRKTALEASERLFKDVADRRWREIFLLTAEMVVDPNNFWKSMKQKVDAIIAEDEKIQQFIAWVDKKSNSINISNVSKECIRAIYFALPLNLDFELSSTLNPKLIPASELNLDCNRHFVLNRGRDLAVAHQVDHDLSLDIVLHHILFSQTNPHIDLKMAFDRMFDLLTRFSLDRAQADELAQHFQSLLSQLPSQVVMRNHSEQIRGLMIHYRDIGHYWKFSNSQVNLLKRYYLANKLLVDCISNTKNLSESTKREIRNSLLLSYMKVHKTSS
ncbi:MAG: NACHT C-terminal helical domain 2-containing protein [Elainellaceae cyanobacterium]